MFLLLTTKYDMAKYNLDNNNHNNNKLSNSYRLDILELQNRINRRRKELGIKIVYANFHPKIKAYERKKKDILYREYQCGIIL